MRDPEVQEKAKRTGTSVVDALGTTLGTVAGEVRDVVNRRGSKPAAKEPAAAADDTAAEALRELDDADAVEEIRADLADDEE